MKYCSSAETVTRTAPVGDIAADAFFVQGNEFLVAISDATAGAPVACVRVGKVRLAAKAGDVFVAGAKVYANTTTSEIEAADTATNFCCGTADGVLSGGRVWVVLNGVALAAGGGDLDAKTDKVIPAVTGSLAGLTAGGNLSDSAVNADMVAAIKGAAAPSALNVIATIADLPPDELTADELAAIKGAAAPSALNVIATIADLPPDELTADQLAGIQGGTLSGANMVMGATNVATEIGLDPGSLGAVATDYGYMNGLPTADDTITVAGQIMIAKAAAGNPDEFTIGGTEDLTIDNLIAAVHALAAGPNVKCQAMTGHKGITVVRADALNGTPVTGDPGAGLTFVASITPASTFVWSFANLQFAPWSAATKKIAHGSCDFSADMATSLLAGRMAIGTLPPSMPAPKFFQVTVMATTGVEKVVTDAFGLDAVSGVLYAATLGATHLAAGDMVSWLAID